MSGILDDRWNKVGRGRLCYTCLRPRVICNEKNYLCIDKIPEVLKCALCASWTGSKGLAPFSIFFCRRKNHGDSRAPLNVLRAALEKYIGKLDISIVDSTYKPL